VLPLATDTWDDEEYEAILAVLKSGKHTMGQKVSEYEEKFAEFFGAKYAVMTNSGSSANLVAVAAHRYLTDPHLKGPREIIVPAIGWSTTYFPFTQLGYKLVFVDVNPKTFNMDPSKLEEAISKDTAGVCVVNVLGNPVEFDEINRILSKHPQVTLFEDNCESLGATYKGKSAGTIGSYGSFSSYFSHHISTIEGGITLTDDFEKAQVMKSMRAHGWIRNLEMPKSLNIPESDPWSDQFRFVLPGYNLRPIEIEAAAGLTQLRKINSILDGRRKNGEYLRELLNEFPDINIQEMAEGSSWFGFGIVLSGEISKRRKDFIKDLTAAHVESRPIITGNFVLNPVIKYLEHRINGELLGVNEIHESGFMIGNHHNDVQHSLQKVVEIMRITRSRYV
jgi:CDP-6-deoxy-D-xylo-4-hexulose-3-dehydrase